MYMQNAVYLYTTKAAQTQRAFTDSLMVLNNGIAGIAGNPTVVVLVTAHLYVAIHSPVSTPATIENKLT